MTSPAVLFMDVDGVLNSHKQWENGFCGIDHDKLQILNGVVEATDCRIVLASAWRYIILGGDMTLKGFRYLLLIHGASQKLVDNLIDHLPADRAIDDLHDRGKLARRWLDQHPEFTLPIALDDGDLGYEANGITLVQPCCNVGLTKFQGKLLINMLSRKV